MHAWAKVANFIISFKNEKDEVIWVVKYNFGNKRELNA